MRLENDLAWTIPILLLTPEAVQLKEGEDALMVDEEEKPVAAVEYRGKYEISQKEYASSWRL
jgi:ATP sulfurylase